MCSFSYTQLGRGQLSLHRRQWTYKLLQVVIASYARMSWETIASVSAISSWRTRDAVGRSRLCDSISKTESGNAHHLNSQQVLEEYSHIGELYTVFLATRYHPYVPVWSDAYTGSFINWHQYQFQSDIWSCLIYSINARYALIISQSAILVMHPCNISCKAAVSSFDKIWGSAGPSGLTLLTTTISGIITPFHELHCSACVTLSVWHLQFPSPTSRGA